MTLRTAAVFAFAVAIPVAAQASSPDAWADFRADVKAKCVAAAQGAGMKPATIIVHPFGTETHGVAVLVAGTDKRICVYDKHTKVAELTPGT